MATVAEELNPSDLPSESIDPSLNSELNQELKDDEAFTSNIYDANLLMKINSLHCPFIWKPEDSLTSYNQDSVEEIMNVDEVFDEPSGFKLRKYVIHLILCYNDFGKRLIEKSLKHLDEMERMLLTSMKNRSQDVYFTQINEALFHILHSCRVFMLHATNQKEKAEQVLKKITPYDELNDTNKAGIWAVRANLYVEFGYDGIKAAIEYIGKSTQIDGDNSYWHFMKGMYLGRLRRMESILAIPSMDEINCLEWAMKLKEDAAFMAFAAEVYVETASRSKKKCKQILIVNEEAKRKLAEKDELISERAAMLFKKSVSLNKNCAHLLFRCGKGMLKLTPPHQDIPLALEYLEKGLELAYESSFGNHAMALYYMKHVKDYDMARKYLLKATQSKNFGADMDLIRVNFLVNQDPEALLDSLQKLFDRYNDKMKHRKILAEIESYYLFINYNLMEAIKTMNKLLYLIGDHDDIISTFKSAVLRQKLPVSLLEILLSDIRDGFDKNRLSSKEQEECRSFMHSLCYQSVTLPRPKNENLRKKVLNEIKANMKDIDTSKAKRSLPTVEKQPRKDYNPAEGRFEKEYAKKYYAEDESSKPQKTVVDEFFEKYEAAAVSKSTVREETERLNMSDNKKVKSKGDSKVHPVLQQLFNQVKKSSNNDNDEEEEEIIDKLARKLDHHFRLSASVEFSRKTSRSSNINVGASTSAQRDHFDSPDIYRRRFSRSPKRRSKSRESHRAGKDSSRKRSDSRDSYRSTKQSRRKRSPSIESRHSNLHSGRRRSVSQDRRSRSTSRDDRSYKNRSLSRERRVLPKDKKISSRKRSRSRDHQSRRRRSVSKDSKYSAKLNRVRSTSRESREDRKSSRRRSISKETKYSSKSNRPRSTSLESKENRKSYKKRSVSRETKHSTESNRSRSTSRESKEDRRFSRKRYINKETKYSTRSDRHRSSSRESKKDRKSSKRRSISRDSKYSIRTSRRNSPSRDRSQSRDERRSRRERSLSKERSPPSRDRSQGRDERRSRRERSLSKERNPPSRDRSQGRDERRSRRERSLSKESRKRTPSKESKRSTKGSYRKGRSQSRESYKSSRNQTSTTEKNKKRSQSKESIRSSKESTRKRRSPSAESRKPSRRQERSQSRESLRSSKSKHSRRERSSSEKRHDRRSQVDGSESKTSRINNDKSEHPEERSRSRDSRYSSKHSSRPECKERSSTSKKYESDDTLTESDNSDTDYKKYKSKKSHQKYSHEEDRRRSYSSDETRSVRSKRSNCKEKSHSKRVPSNDRRDHHQQDHD